MRKLESTNPKLDYLYNICGDMGAHTLHKSQHMHSHRQACIEFHNLTCNKYCIFISSMCLPRKKGTLPNEKDMWSKYGKQMRFWVLKTNCAAKSSCVLSYFVKMIFLLKCFYQDFFYLKCSKNQSNFFFLLLLLFT